METTAHELHCLHCTATLSATDVAEGWCNACGKRLPGSVQTTRSYAATLPAGDPETEGMDMNRMVCGAVIILLSSLVAGIFVFGALS